MKMTEKDRQYIHSQATIERSLVECEPGDYFTVEAQHGPLSGWVTETNMGGNFIVTLDPMNPHDDDRYALVVDYEGAHGSEYAFYVPYTVAAVGDEGMGDILTLEKNGEHVVTLGVTTDE